MSFEVINKGKSVDVLYNGRLFTSCVYEGRFIRPYMGPVMASNGIGFTRSDEKHEEHPHQRSVFVGIGDINGVDFWNENHEDIDTQHGRMELVDFREIHAGENAAVSANLLWKTYEGLEMLDEIRSFRFSEYKKNCIRVDMTVLLKASYMDIEVGATKEAGPLGIRVADFMRADNGGKFVNSEGGLNEDGCWGKNALWCNYSAAAEDGKVLGIAAFDRDTNRDYPTAWHIRNYGLMAANNLYFKGGYSLKKDESVRYDYTICFWEDSFDAEEFAKTL